MLGQRIEEVLSSLACQLPPRLWSKRGQTLAEYAMLIGLVGVGVVVLGLFAFRLEVEGLFNVASDCLSGGC